MIGVLLMARKARVSHPMMFVKFGSSLHARNSQQKIARNEQHQGRQQPRPELESPNGAFEMAILAMHSLDSNSDFKE